MSKFGIPDAIKKSKRKIEQLTPLKTNFVKFNYARWQVHLPGALLKYVRTLDQQTINRNDVIIAFRNYFQKKQPNPMQPILLCLVWGYSNSNVGAFRVGRIANRANRNVFRRSLEAMQNNDIESAYQQLHSIRGLGMSFISKVLYFAGRALRTKKYPLIFDDVVATNLVSIVADKALDNIVRVSRRDTYKALNDYITLLHEWADRMKVPAENLEYFIFRVNARVDNY